MKKIILKIIILTVIVGLNWTGLSVIGNTFAYFSDTESSDNNTYQVGILDFYLDSPTNNFIPLLEMIPGDSVTREINVIKEPNSISFQYKAQAVKISGDNDFCNALALKAELRGETKYEGRLMDFNLNPPVVIDNGGQDNWLFTVGLPSDAGFFPQETCQIKFVFGGWQTNLPDSSKGFSDQEEIISYFTASQGIKINKVYYNVDSEHGEEGKNEWLELYNPLNQAVNLKNWEICDNNDCEIINPNVDIPALGFALISHDASTWNYWNVPSYMVKIHQLGGSLIYLNNDADMLVLKDSNGYIVDQMNWGAPDPGWLNYNSDIWNPGISSVLEGHMLGRAPNGFDTDQPSDFHDLGLPSVEVLFPNGGETWYMVPDSWPQNDQQKAFCVAYGMNENCEYPIRWTATNPDGDDSELLIDIYYSVNSGHSWILQIAENTENDGIFWWKIPYSSNYVTEHGRIKVRATWTQNGMIQNKDISDNDFCPPMLTIDDLLNWENSHNTDSEQEQEQEQEQGQGENQEAFSEDNTGQSDESGDLDINNDNLGSNSGKQGNVQDNGDASNESNLDDSGNDDNNSGDNGENVSNNPEPENSEAGGGNSQASIEETNNKDENYSNLPKNNKQLEGEEEGGEEDENNDE